MTVTGDQSVESFAGDVRLSQPVLVDSEIRFCAYCIGWGFCAYALPISVVRDSLGASDLSDQQLKMAFQVNRHRIARRIVNLGSTYPVKRVVLLNV
jgi:hypothetical protein